MFGGQSRVIEGQRECLGFQQITSLSASTLLTVPVGAILALIQAETQSVRWRDDGTAPTSSVGMIIEANSMLEYNGVLESLKFIEATASAKLNISYYR